MCSPQRIQFTFVFAPAVFVNTPVQEKSGSPRKIAQPVVRPLFNYKYPERTETIFAAVM